MGKLIDRKKMSVILSSIYHYLLVFLGIIIILLQHFIYVLKENIDSFYNFLFSLKFKKILITEIPLPKEYYNLLLKFNRWNLYIEQSPVFDGSYNILFLDKQRFYTSDKLYFEIVRVNLNNFFLEDIVRSKFEMYFGKNCLNKYFFNSFLNIINNTVFIDIEHPSFKNLLEIPNIRFEVLDDGCFKLSYIFKTLNKPYDGEVFFIEFIFNKMEGSKYYCNLIDNNKVFLFEIKEKDIIEQVFPFIKRYNNDYVLPISITKNFIVIFGTFFVIINFSII